MHLLFHNYKPIKGKRRDFYYHGHKVYSVVPYKKCVGCGKEKVKYV